jgi:hypothetical protein
LWRALLSTSTESLLAAAFLACMPSVLLFGPRPLSIVIGILLAWQALAWSSASAASLMSSGIKLTPARAIFGLSPQNTGLWTSLRPAASRRLALAPALALALFLMLAPALAAGGDEPALSRELGIPAPAPIPAHAATRAAPRPSASNRTAATSSPLASASAPGPGHPAASPSAVPSASSSAKPRGKPSASPTPHH